MIELEPTVVISSITGGYVVEVQYWGHTPDGETVQGTKQHACVRVDHALKLAELALINADAAGASFDDTDDVTIITAGRVSDK